MAEAIIVGSIDEIFIYLDMLMKRRILTAAQTAKTAQGS